MLYRSCKHLKIDVDARITEENKREIEQLSYNLKQLHEVFGQTTDLIVNFEPSIETIAVNVQSSEYSSSDAIDSLDKTEIINVKSRSITLAGSLALVNDNVFHKIVH